MKTENIRIAILFHDCDMTSTFESLLNTLMYSFEYTLNENYNPFLSGDKEICLKVLNQAITPLYRLSQNPYGYNTPEDGDWDTDDEFMSRYLMIKPENLLLGDEVDEYVKVTDWNNGEDYILDMRLPKEQRIYRI